MFNDFFDPGNPDGREILVWPVPYEGTVSYGTGTRLGPEALVRASTQIETYDAQLNADISDLAHFRLLPVLHPPVTGPAAVHEAMRAVLQQFEAGSDFLLTLGGDHSIPLPLFEFYHAAHPDMVILHIDAHADLRPDYEGTPLSHASIMARGREMGLPIVQVGIRSVCREQMDYIRSQPADELLTMFAWDLPDAQTAVNTVRAFIGNRPVYLSFDVDGMDPSVIPGTGTPEPGGIGFAWMCEFWNRFWSDGQGPQLIGMDMCELAPIPGTAVSESAAVKLIHKILTAWLSGIMR